MNEKHLPKSYWGEAANMGVYLMNFYTTSRVHNVTLGEKLYGKKPDLSHVRIFGSITYIHIPDEKCILVGKSSIQSRRSVYS